MVEIRLHMRPDDPVKGQHVYGSDPLNTHGTRAKVGTDFVATPYPMRGPDQTIGADGRVRPSIPLPVCWASSPNPLSFLTGTPVPAPIPPSACIPVPVPWSDLIVARVYACVVGQGGGMHGQETETQ